VGALAPPVTVECWWLSGGPRPRRRGQAVDQKHLRCSSSWSWSCSRETGTADSPRSAPTSGRDRMREHRPQGVRGLRTSARRA